MSEVFSSTTNTFSVSLSRSVQFGHLYRKLHNRNWGNSMIGSHIKSPCVSLKCQSNLVFCGGNTRFTHTIAANKRASSHNFKIKSLNLLTITFVAIYSLNRGTTSYINLSSIRVNNTFRKIIDCSRIKHCYDSRRQTSSVVLSKVQCAYFTRSLVDRCQIMTDTYKNNVSKLAWKPSKITFIIT